MGWGIFVVLFVRNGGSVKMGGFWGVIDGCVRAVGGRAFFAEGYWVETSVKVTLSRDEKLEINRFSAPRWELDVVAYKAATDELLVIECKSFLDSTGVQWAELQEGHASTRYKLFREPVLRKVVHGRLKQQMVAAGRCRENASVRLGMAVGKAKGSDDGLLREHFKANDWDYFGPDWLKDRIIARAAESYSNQISSVVAKLLVR